MHDPTTYNTIPTFVTQPGGDWNGFQPIPKNTTATTDEAFGAMPVTHGQEASEAMAPLAPDNYYDTLQALG